MRTVTAPAEVVFLLDVDNTLLDNDAVIADLRDHLVSEFGAESAALYWQTFEALRAELGYADYLGALQRYRADIEAGGPGAHRLLAMSAFLIDYPFASRLYPHALEVLAHLARIGPTVLLSDGDVVFQPRKVQRSGLWDAVDGRVLIYVHKEAMLDAVRGALPGAPLRRWSTTRSASSTAMKESTWGDRLVTVFPRQGHYAFDPADRRPVHRSPTTPSTASATCSPPTSGRGSAPLPSRRHHEHQEPAHAAAARARPEPVDRQHHTRPCSTRARSSATSTSCR